MRILRHLAARGLVSFWLVLLLAVGPSFAQGDNKDQSGKPAAASPGDVAKDNQRKVDEFAEAAQAINGPAGNPECVWLGRRVVQLMYRDDLDTAFRHVDLYDRFGCPGGHIQAAFRCLTRLEEPERPRARLLDHPGGPAADGAGCGDRPRSHHVRVRAAGLHSAAAGAEPANTAREIAIGRRRNDSTWSKVEFDLVEFDLVGE